MGESRVLDSRDLGLAAIAIEQKMRAIIAREVASYGVNITAQEAGSLVMAVFTVALRHYLRVYGATSTDRANLLAKIELAIMAEL